MNKTNDAGREDELGSTPDFDPKLKVEPWMIAAANDLDHKLGFPRFDMAIEWASKIIATHYAKAQAAKATPTTEQTSP